MTKEELMRFANDPFWVRLRWIFFILFWALWLAMLVGAVYIIIEAPKCAAPTPLVWYKQGPLVKIDRPTVDDEQLKQLIAVKAKGVIFTLPDSDTYRLNRTETSAQIKQLVEFLNKNNIHVIVDVTPNYVPQDDDLYKRALNNEPEAVAAFIMVNQQSVPTNWLSTKNGSAWHKYKDGSFVLSQFGENNVDLQLNSTAAKDKFKNVLKELVALGVKGVRLNNFEHYIVSNSLENDEQNKNGDPKFVLTDYAFFLHTHTTNQPGLRELISEFSDVFKSATNGTGFVSVTSKIVKPEDFKVDDKLTIELPVWGTLPRTLASNYTDQTVEQLSNELSQIVKIVGNSSWVQWQYDTTELAKNQVGLSEYNFFLMLLPGVPVVDNVGQLNLPAKTVNDTEASFISRLEEIREGPSYMHGSFKTFVNANKTAIAYSR